MMRVGSAQRSAPGEVVCGDGSVVVRTDREAVIGVADGLGHGPEAAEASRRFCEYVKANPHQRVDDLIRGAHRALAATRGAAAALLRFDLGGHRMSFAGIGNITVRSLSRGSIGPVSMPGTLGLRMRRCVVTDYDVHDDDLFFVYSDGIHAYFELEDYRQLEVQVAADAILTAHGKDTDDATCLVIRYSVPGVRATAGSIKEKREMEP